MRELSQSAGSQLQPLMGITKGVYKPVIVWVPPAETPIGLGFVLEPFRRCPCGEVQDLEQYLGLFS